MKQYITEAKNIERMTLVGPNSESKAVMQQLFEEGWRLIRSGPYSDREMFPAVDIDRFLFIAEREAINISSAPKTERS